MPRPPHLQGIDMQVQTQRERCPRNRMPDGRADMCRFDRRRASASLYVRKPAAARPPY